MKFDTFAFRKASVCLDRWNSTPDENYKKAQLSTTTCCVFLISNVCPTATS